MLLNFFKKESKIYLVKEDRTLLYSCFNQNINICEIGVQTGDNAVNLYNIIKPNKLYLIDPWKAHSWQWLKENNNFTDELIEHYKVALKNWHSDADLQAPDKSYQYFYENVLKLFKEKDNVEIIRKFSEDAVDDIPDNSIDLLYVDGNHTYDYVLKDLTLYEKKVSSGGVIMGNDFLKSSKDPLLTHYEVIEAVLDFCKIKSEWHMFIINNNPYADFILSRDEKFNREFLYKMKKRKFGIDKLRETSLLAYLSTAEEIDFSKFANDFRKTLSENALQFANKAG